MNTTTNTRGVTEAMVDVAVEAFDDLYDGVSHNKREATRAALEAALGEDDFKNFHRLLCERFGYVHDPVDWKRDQLSLIEHIATAPPAQPAERVPEGFVPVGQMEFKRTKQHARIDVPVCHNATLYARRDSVPSASPAPSPARGDGGEG